MSESLKGKAKTGREIFDKLLISGFYDRSFHDYHDNDESREEWVSLEDAEKELLMLNLKNKTNYALAEARAKKLEELKQKLQQLFKEIEPFLIDLDGSKEHFLKKFEELLKEEKEAK
jgi:biopolymer transport protein ExbD